MSGDPNVKVYRENSETKICIKCGRRDDSDNCEYCNTVMREIIVANNMITLSEAEIFIKKDVSDNISGLGYHVGCGGIVDTRKTTKGNKAYCCNLCFLRIEE